VHVYSAGPGNNDVMGRTLFRASAVNQLVASVPSKQRLFQNPPVSTLILEIAISVLTLCWSYNESTSEFLKLSRFLPQ
jgi:hypothetical protein